MMGDPTEGPCDRCGQAHITRHGLPSCAGHRKRLVPLTPCTKRPVDGAAVCATHGAAAGPVKKKAAQRVAKAKAGEMLGIPKEIDPSDAMLRMVWEAHGNVETLRALVQDLDTELGASGIAGHTGNVSKPMEAARHILVAMYDDERERLVRWAKWCRDAGVDERLVQIAEDQGRQLASVLTGVGTGVLAALVVVLEALGVTAELVQMARSQVAQELPRIVAAEIERVAGPDTPPGIGGAG